MVTPTIGNASAITAPPFAGDAAGQKELLLGSCAAPFDDLAENIWFAEASSL
jgi:hypothetical protein